MDLLTEYSKGEISDLKKKYNKVDWTIFSEDEIANIYFKTCKTVAGGKKNVFEYTFLENAQEASNDAFDAKDVF